MILETISFLWIPIVFRFFDLSWSHLFWIWIVIYGKSILDLISEIFRKKIRNISNFQTGFETKKSQNSAPWLSDLTRLLRSKGLESWAQEVWGLHLGQNPPMLSGMNFKTLNKSSGLEYVLDFHLLFPILTKFAYTYKGFNLVVLENATVEGFPRISISTDEESNITDFNITLRKSPSLDLSISGMVTWILPGRVWMWILNEVLKTITFPNYFSPSMTRFSTYFPPDPAGMLRIKILEVRGKGQLGMAHVKIQLHSQGTYLIIDIPEQVSGEHKVSYFAEFPYLKKDLWKKSLRLDALDTKLRPTNFSKRIRLSKACKMKEEILLNFGNDQELLVQLENVQLVGSLSHPPAVPQDRFQSQAVVNLYFDYLESDRHTQSIEPFLELQISDQPVFYLPIPEQKIYSKPETLRWNISKQLLLPVHDVSTAKLSIKLFHGLTNGVRESFVFKVCKRIVNPLQDVVTPKIKMIGEEIWQTTLDVKDHFCQDLGFQWIQLGDDSRLRIRGKIYYCKKQDS